MQMNAEDRARRWARLQEKATAARTAATLGEATQAMNRTEARTQALNERVRSLGRSGYRYTDELDARAATLIADWPAARRQVEEAVRQGQAALGDLDAELARALAEGRRASTEEAMQAAESAVSQAEARARRVAREARGALTAFESRLRRLETETTHLQWAVDAWDAVSFDTYPDEALVDACKARWLTGEDEGPQGVLFLTDQRLVMEQKEKVATRKVLFIATKKELVQALQFAVPIGAVEVQQAEDARGGFLGLSKHEMLALAFSAAPTEGKRVSSARLRLLGGADNEHWVALIRRVQRGDFAAAPAEDAPQEHVAPQDIPTHCPACGAAFTQSIVRGMHELRCEYCGAVVRL